MTRAEDRRQKREDKLREAHIDDTIHALLSQTNGRIFLLWLLELSGCVSHTPFTGEAFTTAFECGKRDLGLQMMARLSEADPEALVKLMQEQANVYRTQHGTGEPDGDGGWSFNAS